MQGYSFYTDLIEEKQKEIRKINRKQKAQKKKDEIKEEKEKRVAPNTKVKNSLRGLL